MPPKKYNADKQSSDPVRRAEMRREARAKLKTEELKAAYDPDAMYEVKNCWTSSLRLEYVADPKSKGLMTQMLDSGATLKLKGESEAVASRFFQVHLLRGNRHTVRLADLLYNGVKAQIGPGRCGQSQTQP